MNVKKMRKQVQRLYVQALYTHYPQRYITGINPESLARWASAWREVFGIDLGNAVWIEPPTDDVLAADIRAAIARIRNAGFQDFDPVGYPLIENENQWKMDGTTGLVAVTQHRGGCTGVELCDCPTSVL